MDYNSAFLFDPIPPYPSVGVHNGETWCLSATVRYFPSSNDELWAQYHSAEKQGPTFSTSRGM